MTGPIEPVRPPLVEPAARARPVARRGEQAHDERPQRDRRDEPERDEEDADGGLHVDVLA